MNHIEYSDHVLADESVRSSQEQFIYYILIIRRINHRTKASHEIEVILDKTSLMTCYKAAMMDSISVSIFGGYTVLQAFPTVVLLTIQPLCQIIEGWLQRSTV